MMVSIFENYLGRKKFAIFKILVIVEYRAHRQVHQEKQYQKILNEDAFSHY